MTSHVPVQSFLDVIVNPYRDYAGINQLLHKFEIEEYGQFAA